MTIFDQETDARADAAADLTKEFWGEGAGWVDTTRQSAFQLQSSDEPTSAFRLDHTPTSMKAIRDGIAAFRPKRRWRDDSTGPVERTREHGVVRAGSAAAASGIGAASMTAPRRPSPERLAHRDATIADLAAGRFDGAPYPRSGLVDGTPVDDTDDELVSLTPTAPPAGLFGAVDPMVVRVALVVITVVLAIPLALALRDDSPTVETDTSSGTPVAEPARGADGGAVMPTLPAADGTSSGASDSASSAAVVSEAVRDSIDLEPASAFDTPTASDTDHENAADQGAATPRDVADVESETSAADARTQSDDVGATDTAGGATVATVTEEAERELPDCSHNYTAGAGDSWYRIAAEAGVTPAALLEQNRATLDTVIFPAAEICLPAGAAMPSPPTTVAAATTPTTAAPTTAAPTTAAPATTTAPAPAPQPTYTSDEVQALIRETWPADQVDKALDIAWRESNYKATADNGWCCVGVFQLYWTVHRGWLDDYGINSRDDLKDARKNIAAAYALYQSSGGWGPWGG